MRPEPQTFSRRNLLRGGAGLGALTLASIALAACSTGSTTASTSTNTSNTDASAAFPVTIKHVYGETVIKSQPQRVATISWVNQDIVVALGVVPVGIPKLNWGQNSNDSSDWLDEALKGLDAGWGSAKAPVQYSEADGINFTEIAKVQPDVIIGAYSGLSKEDYDKLSKIAPVIAYPDTAYGTNWVKGTEMIGETLGKKAEAKALVEKTQKLLADKAAANPDIKGKTFIVGNLEPAKGDGVNIYTANDSRSQILSDLGMTLAPVIAEKSKTTKDFFVPWSAEKANELVSQVFVSWVPDDKTIDAIKKDPLLSQIPAIKSNGFVAYSDKALTMSISAASPLSLPWGIDKLIAPIAEAAKNAK